MAETDFMWFEIFHKPLNCRNVLNTFAKFKMTDKKLADHIWH